MCFRAVLPYDGFTPWSCARPGRQYLKSKFFFPMANLPQALSTKFPGLSKNWIKLPIPLYYHTAERIHHGEESSMVKLPSRISQVVALYQAPSRSRNTPRAGPVEVGRCTSSTARGIGDETMAGFLQGESQNWFTL